MTKVIRMICQKAYNKGGKQGVYDKLSTMTLSSKYYSDGYCKGCESIEPSWRNECLICGQKVEKNLVELN